MSKNDLVEIVKNSFRKVLLVGSLAVMLASCHKDPDITPPIIPPPVKDTPPTAILYTSPTSGTAPLSVHMNVSGTKGTNDITSYRLFLDGAIADSSKYPIDTTITFLPSSHAIYAEVVDTKRLSNQTASTTIRTDQKNDEWFTFFQLPKGKVNPFIYPDSTAEYNTKNLSEKKAFLATATANDITATIPEGVYTINGKQYSWRCTTASRQFSTNCIDYGSNAYEDIINDEKMYQWNMSMIRDTIIKYHGTLAKMGSHKAPVFRVQIAPDHTLNWAVPGNDLKKQEALYFIEASEGKGNVDLSEDGIPSDYDTVMFSYNYKYVKDGKNGEGNISIAKYTMKNYKLTFIASNPNIDLIMTRDTLPVNITVNSPTNGGVYTTNNKITLDEFVTTDTFRYGYYSFDGGQTKIAIRQKDKKDLIYNGSRYFPAGNYTLNLYAKNEFYKDASKNISFTVK
jgi:hypothetical protein